MSLAQRGLQNEIAAWRALGAAPGAESVYKVEEGEGFIAAWWQKAPCGIENNILVDPLGADPSQVFAAAVAGVKRSGAPTWVRGLVSPELERWSAAAERAGFRYDGLHDIWMAAPLSAGLSGADYSIREVKDEAEWMAALSVTGNVYGDPTGLTLFYAPPGRVRLFVAEREGEVLATASLWAFTGVAGIYSVATAEGAREQGLASSVIRQMMAVAAAEGFEWAVLRTFGTLPELYAKLGFTVVGQMDRFVYVQ